MAEKQNGEPKLGPNVTYTNPDKGAKLTTVAGVLLREGKAVDLVKKLGESRSKPILEKLAANRYFKVDGGPDHSKDIEAEATADVNAAQANWAVQEEARIRAKEGDEAADKFLDTLDEDGAVKSQQQSQGQHPQHPHGMPPGQEKKPQPREVEEAELERPSRRNPKE